MTDRAADETTLPRLLRRNARTTPDRPALREKHRGIWQVQSWRQYWDETCGFALGLAASGFGRGDRLSVIGDNRPRLYWAQLAAQSLGGVAVPIYEDATPAELAHVLNDAETAVVVAEDQEQVDKILSLQAQLPHLKLLIYDNPAGLRHYASPLLKSFAEIQAAGRAFAGAHPGYVEAEIDSGTPDELALLSYTSGTTGRPKGVMLSHANLLSAAGALAAAEDVRVGDEFLSYLPMAWTAGSLFSVVLHVLVGFTCNCPEKPETLQRDLRELGPTVALAPPRFWENLLTGITIRAANASPLKRRVFAFFRRLAERAEIARAAGTRPASATRLGLALGEFMVYGPVRDQLGLRRTRWAYTGGAPLGAETFRFFRSFGVNLKQFYGATELAGLASLQPDGQADSDTVGPVLAGTEVRIAADGEVLIRSGAVFRGYHKQPDATRDAMTADGWLRTGDAGFLDGRGHLVIVDRACDVGTLADGSTFTPQFLENKLKFSPYIGEAVAFGIDRPFVVAIVAIDPATVGNWAEKQNVAYTSFQDLSGRAETRRLIRDEIRKCNALLPPATRIRRFLVLDKELDADDAEITRTRKVRRGFVGEKYAAIIEALYRSEHAVEIGADIADEDGRPPAPRSRLAIEDIEEAQAPGNARAPMPGAPALAAETP